MPSLRFANPELQARFLAGLKQLTFAPQIADDGSVVCTEEQWPLVNDVAHKVRDSCFKWYFSWCDTKDGTRETEGYLRANGLRHEIEYHGEQVVFLLPKSDREKHTPPSDDYSGPENCSFCGASSQERQRFFATGAVAICDDCIKWLHNELQSEQTS
jgi:hypothetical protein